LKASKAKTGNTLNPVFAKVVDSHYRVLMIALELIDRGGLRFMTKLLRRIPCGGALV